MKLKGILFVLISLVSLSFQIPKNIQKKVTKEIEKTFEIETHVLKGIPISDALKKTIKSNINKTTFFKIHKNDVHLGYAYISKAPSKTDEFDYLILLDKNLIIKKAKVLIYREDYGSEIGSKRWLKQFIGKTKGEKLIYKKDIVAISGATISANSMTFAINNFLESIKILQKNKFI